MTIETLGPAIIALIGAIFSKKRSKQVPETLVELLSAGGFEGARALARGLFADEMESEDTFALTKYGMGAVEAMAAGLATPEEYPAHSDFNELDADITGVEHHWEIDRLTAAGELDAADTLRAAGELARKLLRRLDEVPDELRPDLIQQLEKMGITVDTLDRSPIGTSEIGEADIIELERANDVVVEAAEMWAILEGYAEVGKPTDSEDFTRVAERLGNLGIPMEEIEGIYAKQAEAAGHPDVLDPSPPDLSGDEPLEQEKDESGEDDEEETTSIRVPNIWELLPEAAKQAIAEKWGFRIPTDGGEWIPIDLDDPSDVPGLVDDDGNLVNITVTGMEMFADLVRDQLTSLFDGLELEGLFGGTDIDIINYLQQNYTTNNTTNTTNNTTNTTNNTTNTTNKYGEAADANKGDEELKDAINAGFGALLEFLKGNARPDPNVIVNVTPRTNTCWSGVATSLTSNLGLRDELQSLRDWGSVNSGAFTVYRHNATALRVTLSGSTRRVYIFRAAWSSSGFAYSESEGGAKTALPASVKSEFANANANLDDWQACEQGEGNILESSAQPDYTNYFEKMIALLGAILATNTNILRELATVEVNINTEQSSAIGDKQQLGNFLTAVHGRPSGDVLDDGRGIQGWPVQGHRQGSGTGSPRVYYGNCRRGCRRASGDSHRPSRRAWSLRASRNSE